jgi:hypothetical protein
MLAQLKLPDLKHSRVPATAYLCYVYIPLPFLSSTHVYIYQHMLHNFPVTSCRTMCFINPEAKCCSGMPLGLANDVISHLMFAFTC